MSIVNFRPVKVPSTTWDIKNPKGETDRLFSALSAKRGYQAMINKDTKELKTGVTVDEFARIMSGTDTNTWSKLDQSDKDKRFPNAHGKYDEFYKGKFEGKGNARTRPDCFVYLEGGDNKFDTSVPRQHLIVKMLKEQSDVAKSAHEINRAVHYFYVEDEDEEAKLRNARFDARKKAEDILYGMSQEERSDFAELYDIDGFSVSPEIIKSRLLAHIESDPGLFVSKYTDDLKRYRILVKKGIRTNVLRKYQNAVYFDDLTLGASEQLAAEYLKDPLAEAHLKPIEERVAQYTRI